MEKQEDREQLWRWCIAGTDLDRGYFGKCVGISFHGEGWFDPVEREDNEHHPGAYVPGQPAIDAALRIERALVLTAIPVPLVTGQGPQGPNVIIQPANCVGLPFMFRHMPTVDVSPTWIIWLRNINREDQAMLMKYHADMAVKTSGLVPAAMLPGMS
jgi:hypothetical protein